jgi:two-component system response regulator TctD
MLGSAAFKALSGLSTMRILLAEDQPQLAESLSKALGQAGFAVDHASDGELADQLLKREAFALVLLDIGLPKVDGWEVLRRLRARGNKVPVLVLTAQGATEDRVKGLDLGADDYLAKPFALAELEARVRALIRRSHGHEQARVQFGPLSFDTAERQFSIDGQALQLTPREKAVLEVLVLRGGRAIGKEALSAQVYSLSDSASPDAVEIYVHRVRKKLQGSGITISLLRGLGYLLEPVRNDERNPG